jgi:hypothetical protein
MNKGVVLWIIAIFLFLMFIIPIDIEAYTKVTQKVPYEKTVHSIELEFENVTTTKLVSRATPYNAQGYREYSNTSYSFYKEINVTVPHFKYGYGIPKNPVVADVQNGKWLFTFNEDNCTTSFRLYNPNYVPINLEVNYTIIQENKKFWVGERRLDHSANISIEARQYTLPIIHNIHREHAYDDQNYEEYFGRGFCNIDENSFLITFQNSTFIDTAMEKDYVKLEEDGAQYYEFNYIGTKYILEEENVSLTETIPHTISVSKTIIEYKDVDRIIKKKEHMPIYLALFVLYDSYNLQKYGLNNTVEDGS